MRFAVPQISRRRSDQFRNFVRVLKFRAIHLDHRARISKQHFGGSLDDARLARARRPQEQQIPHRPPRRIQPGAKHLVQVHYGLHRFVLPHDFPPQPSFKIPRLNTPASRIQLPFHRGVHFAHLPPAFRHCPTAGPRLRTVPSITMQTRGQSGPLQSKSKRVESTYCQFARHRSRIRKRNLCFNRDERTVVTRC